MVSLEGGNPLAATKFPLFDLLSLWFSPLALLLLLWSPLSSLNPPSVRFANPAVSMCNEPQIGVVSRRKKVRSLEGFFVCKRWAFASIWVIVSHDLSRGIVMGSMMGLYYYKFGCDLILLLFTFLWILKLIAKWKSFNPNILLSFAWERHKLI